MVYTSCILFRVHGFVCTAVLLLVCLTCIVTSSIRLMLVTHSVWMILSTGHAAVHVGAPELCWLLVRSRAETNTDIKRTFCIADGVVSPHQLFALRISVLFFILAVYHFAACNM